MKQTGRVPTETLTADTNDRQDRFTHSKIGTVRTKTYRQKDGTSTLNNNLISYRTEDETNNMFTNNTARGAQDTQCSKDNVSSKRVGLKYVNASNLVPKSVMSDDENER